ncbi:MAG TPA: poly-beta-1,6-N-acetyl-D-glucosamine N-deacetylase PgaB [Pseudomonadales bacterium]|jgi:biofilm PGA synthesis lipoprotein PgaB|nr:poly-beta-1,6-N-acetyl-D-glucosamine N-deacetylase PgaB [Cellvibrionales bacterium]HRF87560.1 poly-beta-1,6-N-acetyl-D-glucosamine N-deacetylase PgaB [Pseudomonadales bacterium]HRG50785.1 poly-beta-1,6-N-acetyl-D-glucosamine N-deacetylase PgaB [Pseudomonadales bacterium]
MALRLMQKHCFLMGLLLLIFLLPGTVLSTELITLCYHDVRDDVDGDLDRDPNAVNSKQLAEQFEWLRQNDYHPVSVDQLEAARNGSKPLPARAVLLTFDDGYESFYSRIFPLLKLYNYPAVMALVGGWLDVKKNGSIQFGTEKKDRAGLLSFEQIREMQGSGLVEFASHTYNFHQGVLANPQGNVQPAVVTREYFPKQKKYETDGQVAKRLQQDFQRSRDQLKKITGVAPRVMVWPYGEWNASAENAARALGFRWFFLLGRNVQKTSFHTSGRIQRHLLVSNPSLSEFADMVRPFKPPVETLRVAHVDLDYVYDPDPVRQSANLDKLLDRIKRLHISTVYLQAFADPDGDGNADAVYFPNQTLPVRADLFNRVAWQLKTRAGVSVYAWMPVQAFDLGASFYREHGVRQWRAQGAPIVAYSAYRRLSFFDPVARKRIVSVYSDLAKHASFQGLLFHDDALLDQDEDFHPQAVHWFGLQGLDLTNYAQWKGDAVQRQRFTALKVKALENFTQELTDAVKMYRPEIRTARNLYAETALNPQSADWFAQRLDTALLQYDHVALMAMPWMEKAENPAVWTENLINKLSALSPAQKEGLIVELQTRNWRTEQAIENHAFKQQVKLWKQAGYRHFAWYPDDFHANIPDFDTVFTSLSLQDYPYTQR